MKPVVIDNFLDPTEFNNLHHIILSGLIKWEYVPSIVNDDDGDKFQFVHVFYIYVFFYFISAIINDVLQITRNL